METRNMKRTPLDVNVIYADPVSGRFSVLVAICDAEPFPVMYSLENITHDTVYSKRTPTFCFVLRSADNILPATGPIKPVCQITILDMAASMAFSTPHT